MSEHNGHGSLSSDFALPGNPLTEFKMMQEQNDSISNMFNASVPTSLFVEIARLCEENSVFKNMRVKVKSSMSARDLCKYVFKRTRKTLKELCHSSHKSEAHKKIPQIL